MKSRTPVTSPLRYVRGLTDWYLEPSSMSTSYIFISSDSDDERTGSFVSYIILSDLEAEDVASPTDVLDYVLVLDIDTEPFEALASPDYTP
ncbi:hypothetical protein Tco_1090530 [Tanacetum coccineum]|uniref:Uncharacterized protein n=1 Tax=Tanacetum coccineum TaxID=301880 RepID=A0ABQ5I4H3_9ASTR